ncbi:hypothetical protein FNV43_RR10448 [Rhamnella rubrinervis]|uniref:Uncharacterized protein n=1 Tax=Rhamnella rubrinervis TaxID=2594499 RepID=A0A8K0HBU8_9ROSA|nr:hypothetical protein FNV43_RR10448 [Rhamnella rubrinervis]
MVKRDEKEAEILRLTHAYLSLVEYKHKFAELSHCASHLLDIKERKTRRFKRGLRLELYNAIAILRLPTYADIFRERFASKLDVESVELHCNLCVATPFGVSMCASFMFKSYDVCLENEESHAYLIIVDMFDFDMIFGMDWLASIVNPTLNLSSLAKAEVLEGRGSNDPKDFDPWDNSDSD